MVTKHCCHGECSSDSRKFKKDPNNKIFFIPFPKPHIDAAKCMRWIIACKRQNFDETKINAHTYICSKHFIGEGGPTAVNPDPVSATQSKVKLRLCKMYNNKQICVYFRLQTAASVSAIKRKLFQWLRLRIFVCQVWLQKTTSLDLKKIVPVKPPKYCLIKPSKRTHQ